ncbi:MAG TPA: 4Fe-4S dicluster domain-containing protein, partial [Bacteroidales bacterium]|nr:4Fe-4S dicluster domain-containing protein [Bacteroidales bacterium]
MKRTIIRIDDTLCNGCGICVTGCHEGALRMIDGKAVMVSDLYCDGLGACIPECPQGAISLEEREAEAYNEEAVMERIAPKGDKVILAHLKHLQDHGETGFMNQGIDYLKKHNIKVDLSSLFPTVSKDNTFV